MLKTLKSKITIIYMILVATIAIVGITSVYNFYKLSKSIDGLMVDNYKSINAANNMMNALDSQDAAQISYIYSGSSPSIDNFHESANNFYKWLNLASNNITEKGESNIVDSINNSFLNYQSQFSQIVKLKNTKGQDEALKYYYSNVIPTLDSLRGSLKNLISLNENKMFKSKDNVTASATKALYVILTLSVVVIVFGFVISNFLTNMFLKPLYSLKEHMITLKEGNLDQQAEIQSDDEIGDFAAEFNRMTRRLLEFEKSTKGMLMKEKNKTISVLKSISDPVIVLDIHHRIMFINHSGETFFDITEEQALGKHFMDAIKNIDIYNYILDSLSFNEDKYVPKIISINKDNKEFFFDTIITKVKDEKSNLDGFVLVFQNITKLKRLEKTRTEFLSTISHEFKTPLTSIMMGTSLMKSGKLGELSDSQNDIVDTIEDESEKLTALVTDILELSKIESEKEVFRFEPCSIYGIVENSIKNFRDLAREKGIVLYSTIENNLPMVRADYEKIYWVINNLISNASKYTSGGDEIVISAAVSNGNMHISVRDTGKGIPEEYKDKIFDKFVRVETADDETSGTGLGLAIVKDIVETHSGIIWVDSEPGKGSTFTFTLPLSD